MVFILYSLSIKYLKNATKTEAEQLLLSYTDQNQMELIVKVLIFRCMSYITVTYIETKVLFEKIFDICFLRAME